MVGSGNGEFTGELRFEVEIRTFFDLQKTDLVK